MSSIWTSKEWCLVRNKFGTRLKSLGPMDLFKHYRFTKGTVPGSGSRWRQVMSLRSTATSNECTTTTELCSERHLMPIARHCHCQCRLFGWYAWTAGESEHCRDTCGNASKEICEKKIKGGPEESEDNIERWQASRTCVCSLLPLVKLLLLLLRLCFCWRCCKIAVVCADLRLLA